MLEEFDGNLVFLAHDVDIQDGKWYLQPGGSERFAPVSRRLIKVSLDPRVEIMEKAYGSSGFINYEEIRSQNLEIYDLLKKGRMRFSLLLNSPGGWGGAMERVRVVADAIRAKGGEVASFGGSEVSSAAANLFMMPLRKNRFLCNRAKLMFHLGSNSYADPEERARDYEKGLVDSGAEEVFDEKGHNLNVDSARGEIEDARKRDERSIRTILLVNTAKKMRRTLKAHLDKLFNSPSPNNPDCRLALGAIEALLLGWATVGGLKRPFERFNEIDSKSYRNTKIGDFIRSHK